MRYHCLLLCYINVSIMSTFKIVAFTFNIDISVQLMDLNNWIHVEYNKFFSTTGQLLRNVFMLSYKMCFTLYPDNRLKIAGSCIDICQPKLEMLINKDKCHLWIQITLEITLKYMLCYQSVYYIQYQPSINVVRVKVP